MAEPHAKAPDARAPRTEAQPAQPQRPPAGGDPQLTGGPDAASPAPPEAAEEPAAADAWGLDHGRRRVSRETWVGLALILVLLAAFGFVVSQKLDRRGEAAAAPQDGAADDVDVQLGEAGDLGSLGPPAQDEPPFGAADSRPKAAAPHRERDLRAEGSLPADGNGNGSGAARRRLVPDDSFEPLETVGPEESEPPFEPEGLESEQTFTGAGPSPRGAGPPRGAPDRASPRRSLVEDDAAEDPFESGNPLASSGVSGTGSGISGVGESLTGEEDAFEPFPAMEGEGVDGDFGADSDFGTGPRAADAGLGGGAAEDGAAHHQPTTDPFDSPAARPARQPLVERQRLVPVSDDEGPSQEAPFQHEVPNGAFSRSARPTPPAGFDADDDAAPGVETDAGAVEAPDDPFGEPFRQDDQRIGSAADGAKASGNWIPGEEDARDDDPFAAGNELEPVPSSFPDPYEPVPERSRRQVPARGPDDAFEPPVAADRLPDVVDVRPGDNFWVISRRAYGTPRYFSALARYNQDRIPDPRKMLPGMKVLVPAAEVLRIRYPDLVHGRPQRASASDAVLPSGYFVGEHGQAMYRVGPEDTLGDIARRHLGRSSRWKQIHELNRDSLTDPHNLTIGLELRLPADASRVRFMDTRRGVR